MLGVKSDENKELQKRYREWVRETQLQQIYTITFITASLYLILAYLDKFIAPQDIYGVVIFFHMILIPFALYFISFLAYHRMYYKLMLWMLMISPVVAALVHGFIISYYDVFSVYHVEIYLILFWLFTVSGLELKHATIVATLVCAISIVSILYIEKLNYEEFIMHIFWLFATFVFGFASGVVLNKSRKNLFEYHLSLGQELANKNMLLKELAHRVKNNLQIISGLLYTNLRKVEDKTSQEILKNSIQTVHSMGILHEKLYQSESLEVVDFQEYLAALIRYIKQSTTQNDIVFEISSQNIYVGLKNAVPLGLVVNEILTNSVKYAFDASIQEREKRIRISIHKNENQDICLQISDNGKGVDMQTVTQRYGMKLIDSLVVYQLKGEIHHLELDVGFGYEIRFHDDAKGGGMSSSTTPPPPR